MTNAAIPAIPAQAAAPARWRLGGAALLLALACALPFVVGNYGTFKLTLVLADAMALLGLNILTGYSGQVSLGHGAFFAIGAYAAAILMERHGVPYALAVPAAGALCFAAGFAFGLPALRLEGLYLGLATFALGVSVPQVLKHKQLAPWTGGVQGMVVTQPDAPLGLKLGADQWLYFYTLALAVVLFVAARNLLAGRVGRALIAIRDHPVAAAAMGVDTAIFKTLAFGVSAMYTGIAGALAAIAVQFVAPDSFDIFVSIGFLVGAVVGGIASVSGALYGAAFIQFVPGVADRLSKSAPWAVYGVFLIGFMLLMPGGIQGAIRQAWGRVRGARAARAQEAGD